MAKNRPKQSNIPGRKRYGPDRPTAWRQLAMLAVIPLALLLVCLSVARPARSQGADPPPQPANLIYDEMRTVYLGNLARRANGVPPLRWNVEMTDAARWFSWDSVENRPEGFCGHDDTLGRAPWDRMADFGYMGFGGAENCYCGYVTPEQAIEGWMNSPGHRDNLLSPTWQEVGLGYYRRASDGRGYVTQDFGVDSVYPPLIVENEAIATTSPAVDLYLYSREGGGGFTGAGPAVEMMVANDACFTGASWQPYAAERSWTLAPGTGWRTVYARTRDVLGRTTTVSDTIYLGEAAPLDELGLHLAARNRAQVTLHGLDGGGLPSFQLSQNWFADDGYETFKLYWGNGEAVEDAAALGGTAFRLTPGDGESFAWVWTTEFFKDTPFVAYFRLKTSDNTWDGEVARISVKGGGTEYGPVSLKGTDFEAANAYQEFPLAFTFHTNPDDVFLLFNFWRSGPADIYVDGAYIFTAPRPVQSPYTWAVPGGHYRGGGIWLRYTDGAGTFSPVEEADLFPRILSVSPTALSFLAEAGAPPPAGRTLVVSQEGYGPFSWSASGNAAWLQVQEVGDTIQVGVDTAGLSSDTYQALVTVEAEDGVLGSPAQIPVTLLLVDELQRAYLPLVIRRAAP
jgi:uncharacterized protein YkwD